MQDFFAQVLHGYSIMEVGIFAVIVVAALLIDLHSHKKDEPISLKNAAIWSVIWVLVSIAFGGYVYQTHGVEQASMFFSGYLLEKSLSVDNLFVFMAIFSSFAITGKYQHRILYYGIIGAIIMRLIFVSIGSSLLLLGDWVLLLFGVIVIYTAIQMLKSSSDDDDELTDYSNHFSVRWTSKIFPIYPKIDNHNFFNKNSVGSWAATPLFLCLVVIEISDVLFAFDSVPAVIAITKEPFLIYTSNIFAILGLRSMYFLLAAAKRYLCHLEKAVIVILLFIGAKLIGGFFGIHITQLISLSVVFISLLIGILASVMFPTTIEETN